MEDELSYRQDEEVTLFFFCIPERSEKMYDHHSSVRIFLKKNRRWLIESWHLFYYLETELIKNVIRCVNQILGYTLWFINLGIFQCW